MPGADRPDKHVFSDRQGPWLVSITGSRASEDWELRVAEPNGFERSYVIAGAVGEHEPEAIRSRIAQFVSASRS
jgi:hypothetical protein